MSAELGIDERVKRRDLGKGMTETHNTMSMIVVLTNRGPSFLGNLQVLKIPPCSVQKHFVNSLSFER